MPRLPRGRLSLPALPVTQPSVYTKQSGPRSGSREKFSPRKKRRDGVAGVTSKGACHRCGIRRGAGLLLSCLSLAWACLLCGSPERYPHSQELVQEDLNTRATRRCQHDSQARHLGRCLLLSMSMEKSGSYLPLLTAVAALISPSALAKEQSHFQNMAQLLQLDIAWRHIPRGPGQVLCWICRGHSAAASSIAAVFSQ